MRFLKRFWIRIDYKVREISWMIQRARRGWSDRDAWGIDGYLCEILPPMLERLKDSHVIPMEEMTEEDWNQKLDIMRIGFIAAKRMLDLDYPTLSGAELRNAINDDSDTFKVGMDVFAEHFFSLWD